MAGTAPLGWGGNTAGILKIKGLETVAWLSQLWGGVGARQGQWDVEAWRLSTRREQPGQGSPILPCQLTAWLSQEHSLPTYINKGLAYLPTTYYVPGLRTAGWDPGL